MKKQITVAIVSMLTLTACSNPAINEPSTKARPIKSSEMQQDQNKNQDTQSIFYLNSADVLLTDNLLAEHKPPASLIVYNQCLSVRSFLSGKTYTLATPNANEILFDDNQNVIGLLNKKSKRRILIGDEIVLDSTNTVNANASTKPVPKDCSQELLITAAVE
ncbi:hypothetical protein [Moraxella cuniculi]|uniref:Lipoprotein n=1 Tax=Moraxella cuniculi TaxID=34061 RepID=A0A3S4RJW0_9GAMM|nr:hypothetical protein [Moraxella cuniculi]VEG12291.1 Uncharacterised protein [Moraxella cuniculi]